jgi:phosphatidylglycerol:prolipoprotein diacylglycerol transferase
MPNGFDIPIPFLNTSLHIYFYGILITVGVIAAAFLSQEEARRRKFNTDYIWDVLFWVVVAGIVGARLWHIFTPPPSMLVVDPNTGKLVNPYFAGGVIHLLDIIDLRRGGLGIPGAILGGALALGIYCRSKHLSFLTWADVMMPGVALAQAIGRWGNFFNQELYGLPTNLPWKIYIDPAHRVAGYTQYAYFQPLFLYESIWNLINMGLLLWVGRRFAAWLKAGDLLYIYMIMYAVARFGLEFLRLDASMVFGIDFNQAFMVVVALAGAGLFYWNHRPRRSVAVPA